MKPLVSLPLVARLLQGPARRLLADRRRRGVFAMLTAPWFEQAFAELMELAHPAFTPAGPARQGQACLVIGTLGPGGAERQLANTAIGLARDERWHPAVATANPAEGTSSFHLAAIEAAGVSVRHIPLGPPRLAEPMLAAVLQKLSRFDVIGFSYPAYHILRYACFFAEQRPELVHTWMDEMNVFAGLGAVLAGVPRLVLNGRSVAPHNFGIFQPYMRQGYRCLLQARPDVTFTNNSAAGAADYARWLGLPRQRIQVHRNGFDFPAEIGRTEPAQALRASLGIPATARVLGGLLRFTEEKQPALWVRTALRVVERDPAAWAVVFGDGPLREPLRAMLATAPGGERVLLPGLTEDAFTALRAMDVLMLTSRLEGLPNVLVEAQAMGVPVIATGGGGMRETYVEGVTGLTAARPTVAHLAALAGGLLGDAARRQDMSRRAASHARAEFSRDAMIARTRSIFDKAAQA